MRDKNKFSPRKNLILHFGDCMGLLKQMPDRSINLTVTSPPYFMGKNYDKSKKLDDFIKLHEVLLPEINRVTKDGGSICWQVGYHVKDGAVEPLDFYIHNIISRQNNIYLRNRIIWTFGHGLHSKKRMSGRHEIILWYTKGNNYYFDLDSIRVPQKYPGKRFYKGEKKGKFSGNPKGKNPTDVWEIPNVKANHVEKTNHPCQFPIALAQRLIKGLCPINGVVLDPFMGTGTTGAACIIEMRQFIGAEIDPTYYNISLKRCSEAKEDKLKYRCIEKPILVPNENMAVAIKPIGFK